MIAFAPRRSRANRPEELASYYGTEYIQSMSKEDTNPNARTGTTAQTGTEATMAISSSFPTSNDWDLVVSALHHTGELREQLTVAQQQTVRRAADGFGIVCGLDGESLDMLWDWSHVRDSSQKAVGRMAMLVRIMLAA